MNFVQSGSSDTPLFWIDLEMTGLDIETDVILEVAVIITDQKLQTLDQFEHIR